ncbi:class I SAM-dependent methyltransferase [Parafrigoribacterium soli]|uniref:class I SAM-dependent methyltransferase n=1 Tax=Parafrigoribacterium soli TaxID=3144663 RepID=UPI0032EDA1A4
MAANNDESAPQDTSYVEWKGWVTEVPFGDLPRGEKAYFNRELRDVTRRARPIRSVLEVGFGNGAFLEYCRGRGWQVAGTELELELIDAARIRGFTAYSPADVDKIPDDSLDLIAAFDVLEHIPQEHVVALLQTLSTKLRSDGCMIFRFPNVDSWLGNPLQFGDPTHVTAIGYLKMTNFALRSGLRIVTFRAATRHGFATSIPHGIYGVVVAPIVDTIAYLKRLLYFPGIPVVLSTSNVVCVVQRR